MSDPDIACRYQNTLRAVAFGPSDRSTCRGLRHRIHFTDYACFGTLRFSIAAQALINVTADHAAPSPNLCRTRPYRNARPKQCPLHANVVRISGGPTSNTAMPGTCRRNCLSIHLIGHVSRSEPTVHPSQFRITLSATQSHHIAMIARQLASK